MKSLNYILMALSMLINIPMIFGAGDDLWNAVYKGDVAKIEDELKKQADVNYRHFEGYGESSSTPLMLAIALYRYYPKNIEKIIRLLLDAGANPNEIEDNGGNMLHYAIGTDLPLDMPSNIYNMLLEKADVNVRDQHGETALMKAAHRGNTRLMKMLLEKGAKADLKNKWEKTAVDIIYQHRKNTEYALQGLEKDLKHWDYMIELLQESKN